MTRLATDTQWLRHAGGLTVQPDNGWPTDQILGAKLRVIGLVCAARGVAASPAAGRACAPAAAALAEELCQVDVPDYPAVGVHTAAQIVERYEQALWDAAGAVYYCRRTEHASGRCLFSAAGPAADVCGRVLVAGHRSTGSS